MNKTTHTDTAMASKTRKDITSDELYDALADICKQAEKQILRILRRLKTQTLNLRHLWSEWNTPSAVHYTWDRHDFAVGYTVDRIKILKNKLVVEASDEEGGGTFKWDELAPDAAVCLLSAVEEASKILTDPENKDIVDWNEVFG